MPTRSQTIASCLRRLTYGRFVRGFGATHGDHLGSESRTCAPSSHTGNQRSPPLLCSRSSPRGRMCSCRKSRRTTTSFQSKRRASDQRRPHQNISRKSAPALTVSEPSRVHSWIVSTNFSRLSHGTCSVTSFSRYPGTAVVGLDPGGRARIISAKSQSCETKLLQRLKAIGWPSMSPICCRSARTWAGSSSRIWTSPSSSATSAPYRSSSRMVFGASRFERAKFRYCGMNSRIVVFGTTPEIDSFSRCRRRSGVR